MRDENLVTGRNSCCGGFFTMMVSIRALPKPNIQNIATRGDKVNLGGFICVFFLMFYP